MELIIKIMFKKKKELTEEEKRKILDEFGKNIIDYVYDSNLHDLNRYLVGEVKHKMKRKYNIFFSTLVEKDKKNIRKYMEETSEDTMFDFLRFFEENPQFKIIHEDENGNQTDLNKISEMLKAEPIIEGGWIERFSKYSEDFKKRKEEENKQFED